MRTFTYRSTFLYGSSVQVLEEQHQLWQQVLLASLFPNVFIVFGSSA